MATTALVVGAERWLDEVILRGTISDVVGADFTESWSLPAGLGDIALMNLLVIGFGIDVFRTTVNAGVRAEIRSADVATRLDVVGAAPFVVTQTAVGTAELTAFLDPDALVLWRQGELLTLVGAELDTDATPTGDLSIAVKAVRVKPVESAPGPLRLVR